MSNFYAAARYNELAPLCDGLVHLFVRPSVRLSVCRQIAYTKTLFAQKLSNFELRSLLLTTYIGSHTWAFQTTYYWTPKIQDGRDPPSCKS